MIGMFKNKILFSIMSLMTLIIVIFSLVIFFISSEQLMISATERLLNETQQAVYFFDSEFNLIKNTVNNFGSSVENKFDGGRYKNFKEAYFNPFFTALERDIYDISENYIKLKSAKIKSLYFYTNPEYFGDVYGISYVFGENGTIKKQKPLEIEFFDDENVEMQWFYEPIENGVSMWIEPYYWGRFDTRIISYVEPVLYKGKPIGIVGIDVDVTDINDYLDGFRDNSNSLVYLMNTNAEIILSENSNDTDFSEINGFSSRNMETVTAHKNVFVYEHNGYLNSYGMLSNDWVFMITTSNDEIYAPIKKYFYLIFLIAAVFLTTSFFLSRHTAKKISKPLELLAFKMKKYKIGEKIVLENTGIKELDTISFNFKTLIKYVQRSYDAITEKKDELKETYLEIEEAYKTSESLAHDLEEIINLTSSLSSMAENNETEYLKNILTITMNMVKYADRGLITRYDKGVWREIYSIGYPEGVVNNNILPVLRREKQDHLFSQYAEKIKKRHLNILYTPLYFGENLLGAIVLTNSQHCDVDFSGRNKTLLKAFANLTSAFFGIQKQLTLKTKFRESILYSMIKLVELHDPYTKGHSENVSRYSVLIAKQMNLTEKDIDTIKWAGLVHDIGKILIPKGILTKPSKLNENEYAIIKKHPGYGATALSDPEEVSEVSRIVKYHHERWDGKGYPEGLAGKSIPFESRIISVADTFDAMTSDRPYRKGLSVQVAKSEIEKNSGIQFDPDVVKAFLELKL